MSTFTPPVVQHAPPFLPSTRGIARRLFRHMNPQFYGVDVFKLSDGTYVQTEATAENSNVAVPPFPPMPDQGSTPNLIARSMYYTQASGYTEVDTTVTPYVVIAYWGGRNNPVSAADVTALTNFTAHGIGYGGCIH